MAKDNMIYNTWRQDKPIPSETIAVRMPNSLCEN